MDQTTTENQQGSHSVPTRLSPLVLADIVIETAKEVDRRAVANWGTDLPEEFRALHEALAVFGG